VQHSRKFWDYDSVESVNSDVTSAVKSMRLLSTDISRRPKSMPTQWGCSDRRRRKRKNEEGTICRWWNWKQTDEKKMGASKRKFE